MEIQNNNSKLALLAFIVLIMGHALICLVPFNFLPDLVVNVGKNIPLHVLLYSLMGLFFLFFSLKILVRARSFPIFLILFSTFAGSMILSLLVNQGDKFDSWQFIVGFVLRGVIPGMVAYVLTCYFDKGEAIFAYLFYAGFIVAAASLFEPLTGKYFLIKRTLIPVLMGENYDPGMSIAVGGIGQPHALSNLLNLFLPISVIGFIKYKKIFLCIIPLCILWAVAMTFRRTGLMLSFLSLSAIGVFVKSSRKWVFVLCITLFAVVMGLMIPKNTRDLITSRFDFISTAKNIQESHRFKSYKTVYRIFKINPWLGIGTRRYGEIYKNFTDNPAELNSPDNQYLLVLAEEGVVGVTCFLWLIIYLLVHMFKYIKNIDMYAYFLAVAVLAISMMFFDSLYWPAINFTFFIIAGTGLGVADYRKKRADAK